MDLNFFKTYIPETEKNIINNKVWVYTRVSSKEQFDTNSSIKNQNESAEIFAKKKNYIIEKTFGGTYESARGDFSRKEFTKLLNEIKKAKQKPFGIIIFKINRFSRSGANAIKIVEEIIHKYGVHLIEVESEMDTSTTRGEHFIMEQLLKAKKENIDRLAVTIPGMKTLIKNGDWLGKAPLGYQIHGSRVTNEAYLSARQKIVITEEGKLLKKAWTMKLNGEPDFKIIEKMNSHGLKISKQKMSAMWRNPFYCGISTHKFLEGTPIRGNWKPIVRIDNFKKINKTFETTRSGYKQSKYPEGRPLLHHLFCGNCSSKMTGYMAKGKYPYYKCQTSNCTTKDMNAITTPKSIKKGLNNIFNDYLSNYALDSKLEAAFKEQMRLTFKQLDNEQEEEHKLITKRISVAQTKLESLTNKYLFEGFPLEMYDKFKIPLEKEIEELNEELSNINSKISNQDKKIEDCVEVAKNISKYWASGSTHTKTRIQKLVFPKGVVINPENRQYRTNKVNMIFLKNSIIPRDVRWEIKNPSAISSDGSYLVAGTGLEPVTFGL